MLIAERYEVKNKIGVGGMGTVYLGSDSQTGMPVAIKQLKPELIADDPDQLDRFIREGELLRQLNHPNIVKMLSAAEQESGHYLVMEYVDGGSLYDVLAETPRLSVQRTLYIALDVADALTRAHRLSILHRDIKPANILLGTDGTPRLTDFGMARSKDDPTVTQEGMIVGTLAYLSPEALTGEDVDERSDIWALGITLFEMLAGERPFPQKNTGQLVNAIITAPIPDLELIRPDLPTALVDLINRMLERDRHARIPSVRLIGAEIEAIMRGATSSMQYISVTDSTGRFESDQFTPPPTSAPIHNLPSSPTPFIGRDEEVFAVSELVNNPDTRLITLLGSGGIGKSRIALAVAEKFITPLFSDGVFFVPLAQIDESDRLIPTIAEYLKFNFAGADDPRTQLMNYLQEKKLLLILDTFEHLTDNANLISDILETAPGVQIMVTSRERLRLRGETIYEVQGMMIPSYEDSAENLCCYPVAKLFYHSAKRVMPDFELNPDTSPYVARIAELVGGIPLGVELAAAWLEMLPLDEISREIEASLDFLETDLRDVPARHRSIRAVFDYSWNLLTDDEKDVFMKLAIFRGGFEREAAQKITGASLRTLTNLNNKSLITRDPTGRYRLNKLSRQYAEEQLAKHADKEAIHMCHAEYYGELLIRVSPLFNTSKEKNALEEIEKELENINIARKWAQKHGKWDILEQVLRSLLMFYATRSLMKEGTEAFDDLAQALKAAGQGDSSLYWQTRLAQAWIQSRMGNYDLCWNYSNGAYEYFRKHKIRRHMGDALNIMSYIRMMQGQYTESADYAKQALDYVNNAPDSVVWYMAMGNWGYAEYLHGHYEEAYRIYEEILERGVETSPSGRAYYLNNQGEILRSMGKHDRAMELFKEANAVFKSYRMTRGMAFTQNNIGGILFMQGRHEEAQSSYEEAYRLHRQTGDQSGVGHSLSALGNIAMFRKEYQKACDLYSESLTLRRKLGDIRGVGDSLIDLGRTHTALENFDQAQKFYEESLMTHREIEEMFGVNASLAGLANILVIQEKYDEAMPLLDEALAIGKELKNVFLQLQTYVALSEINLARGDYAQARVYATELMSVASKIKIHSARIGALVMMLFCMVDDVSQHDYIYNVLMQVDTDHSDLKIYMPSSAHRIKETLETIKPQTKSITKLDLEAEFTRLYTAVQQQK